MLGLALDRPGADFAERIATTDAVEVRRYLVGEYVPAWRGIVGHDVLAAAAEGDPVAAAALLRDRRYYGGRARESLKTLLPLSAEETRARLAEAVDVFAREVFAPVEAEVTRSLTAARAEANRLAESLSPEALIDRLAAGYRYEREAGLDEVVLVPHSAATPWLLLCQHRNLRVICHPARREEAAAERLLQLGRALSDPGRIAIIERLRGGPASLQELADELGLAKSTVHHHAGQLRAARLIALQGNASRYEYVLEAEGFAAAVQLLSDLR
jgi:DNA-binding transcriptional ArsR family regulator